MGAQCTQSKVKDTSTGRVVNLPNKFCLEQNKSFKPDDLKAEKKFSNKIFWHYSK